MAASSKVTSDHETIKSWIEARGGWPATVKTTKSKNDVGILRVDFPGYSGKESLEKISWDDFFEKFDEKHLKFLYQDETRGGKQSRFCKFVSADSIQEDAAEDMESAADEETELPEDEYPEDEEEIEE